MGNRRPTNEDFHIGDIFVDSHSDEDGHSCSFYQVVGKRGKTLVELHRLKEEYYLDEKCRLCGGEIRIRPLPGQFSDRSEAFTVSACEPSHLDGSRWLHGRGERNLFYYHEYKETVVYDVGGHHGLYTLASLIRERRFPPLPDRPVSSPVTCPLTLRKPLRTVRIKPHG